MAGKNLVESIADTLLAEILEGRPAPGGKLASEWSLVARFSVARVAVREAISRLRALGVVRARRGSGVEVLDWRRDGGVELIPALLRAAGPASPRGRALIAELLRARRAFAVDVL